PNNDKDTKSIDSNVFTTNPPHSFIDNGITLVPKLQFTSDGQPTPATVAPLENFVLKLQVVDKNGHTVSSDFFADGSTNAAHVWIELRDDQDRPLPNGPQLQGTPIFSQSILKNQDPTNSITFTEKIDLPAGVTSATYKIRAMVDLEGSL